MELKVVEVFFVLILKLVFCASQLEAGVRKNVQLLKIRLKNAFFRFFLCDCGVIDKKQRNKESVRMILEEVR